LGQSIIKINEIGFENEGMECSDEKKEFVSDHISEITNSNNINDSNESSKLIEKKQSIYNSMSTKIESFIRRKSVDINKSKNNESIGNSSDISISDLSQKEFFENYLKNSNDLNNTINKFGTLTHLAPEALSLQYNSKSDVYSFGSILFELLTNDYPWKFDINEDDENIVEVVKKLILSTSPTIPSEFIVMKNVYIVEKFLEIAKKCWSLDYRERPSFGDVLLELNTLKENLNKI
jgi:hypothetical protein